jgi:hypothetical protein
LLFGATFLLAAATAAEAAPPPPPSLGTAAPAQPPSTPPPLAEKRSRLIAFVPFGAGQLQNGDTGLGILLLASQALAAGSSIAFGAAHTFYASVDPTKRAANGAIVDRSALAERIQIAALGNQISFGAWAALAVAGIIQANVAFTPGVETRDRSGRPRPAVVPMVVASGDGVSVGLVGNF